MLLILLFTPFGPGTGPWPANEGLSRGHREPYKEALGRVVRILYSPFGASTAIVGPPRPRQTS